MGMVAQFKVISKEDTKIITEDPSQIAVILFPEDAEDPFKDQLSLDKEWHVIHYILCGSDSPNGTALGDAILGGSAVGGDLGYGPARLILPDQIKTINSALTAVDFHELCQNVNRDSSIVKELYSADALEEDTDYVLEKYFQKLVKLYSENSKGTNSILTYLC